MWLTFAPSGIWCEAWLWNKQSAEREKRHVTARNKNRHYSRDAIDVKLFREKSRTACISSTFRATPESFVITGHAFDKSEPRPPFALPLARRREGNRKGSCAPGRFSVCRAKRWGRNGLEPYIWNKKVIDRPRVFCYILALRFHPKNPLSGRKRSHTKGCRGGTLAERAFRRPLV